MSSTVEGRFWAKVDKDGPGGCWLWTAYVMSCGYGQFSVGSRMTLAHRWSYERFVGPVPDGLELDHLCRTRACVRPDHLEAVTHLENVRRGAIASKTRCVRGHPFDEENTSYRRDRVGRRCRACHRDGERNRQRRIREAAR